MSRVIFGSRQSNCASRFIAEMDNSFVDFQGSVSSYRSQLSASYTAKPKPVVQQKVSMVGKLVVHDELGSGVIIEDNGDVLTVAFKNRGIKKVARNFLRVIA
jgi:hypothetical protein